VAAAALAASLLVSYAQARGETVNVSGSGGLMQRGERLVLTALGCLLDPTLSSLLGRPEGTVLFWILAVIATGAFVTAVYRTAWIARRLRQNASRNCVDRHLKTQGDTTAIIWAQDEVGAYKHITYRELKHNVCRVANVLLAHGVRKGDRVCIYMPMIPELAYAMLACARIGAVHSVVFGGFSAEALRDRILDARCKMVMTANEGLRGGRRIPLKKTVDRAIE